MATKGERLRTMYTQFKVERRSFVPQWRVLGQYFRSHRTRFTEDGAVASNKGDRTNQAVINSVVMRAPRTLRSGMMAGVTSSARPWFRLTTPDPGLAEMAEVKRWLSLVTQRMNMIFLRSNLYKVLPIMYGDMAVFGTASMSVMEDFDNVIRCYDFPVGSYYMGVDDRMRVNTFLREFDMTVQQVVSMFGLNRESQKIDWSKISERVKEAWDRGATQDYVRVHHVIEPNTDWDVRKIESKFKRYSETYYEQSNPNKETFLSESGYDEFPVMTPRWEVIGGDPYGTNCPGMESLGDAKALQVKEKRKAQAIDKGITPPMGAPSSLKTQRASLLPGDITYFDARDGQNGFKPIMDVDPRFVQLLIEDIAVTEQRISGMFYEDLFLMMATSTRREITAREIDERHEEKLLALGPVLEQLNQDLLDPLIDRTFDLMLKFSEGSDDPLIPRPPPDLEGIPLRVEYVSIMAQAQKLIGIASLERTSAYVGQIAAFKPEIIDKVDWDQAVDEYGDMTGVSPRVIRPDDEVEGIREDRAAQEQAAVRSQQMREEAAGAKDLASADLEGDNALTRLLETSQAGELVEQ